MPRQRREVNNLLDLFEKLKFIRLFYGGRELRRAHIYCDNDCPKYPYKKADYRRLAREGEDSRASLKPKPSDVLRACLPGRPEILLRECKFRQRPNHTWPEEVLHPHG